jgi:hypothetical protein
MSAVLRLAVLLSLLACSIPVSAASYVVWQGNAVVTAANTPCFSGAGEREEIRRGTVLKSIVRPKLLASNGNNSRMAFILNAQSEFALALAGGFNITGSGDYAAFGVTTNGAFKTNVGGTYKNFKLNPSSPTPTDTFLTLTGTINDFMFISGCTISFRAGYSLRP